MQNNQWVGAYPPTLDGFHNAHQGETCIIIGNGKSLADIPAEFIHSYPSFGSNTICLNKEIKPTYYVAVDSRILREFKEKVDERLHDIPQFVPKPNLDKWHSKHVYRFYHRPGPLWPYGNGVLWPRDILGEDGITYNNVTHVVMQIAYFMGFTKLLIVGMDHKNPTQHFWGNDEKAPGLPDLDLWAAGYQELAEGFEPRTELVNISTQTELPEEIIRRDTWRNYVQ